MDQTSSILYAANHKQERIPCSDENTVLQPYSAKGDGWMCEIQSVTVKLILSRIVGLNLLLNILLSRIDPIHEIEQKGEDKI